MALPMTPRSRTLAALSVSRGTYLDTISVRKWHLTLAVFFISWFILFSIFISYYPSGIMRNSDFLETFNIAAASDSDKKSAGNNVLSDGGRSLIWGSSLGFGFLVAVIYHFFYLKFF